MKKIGYIALLLGALYIFGCTPDIDLRDLPTSLPKNKVSVDATDPNQPILTVEDGTVFNATWDFGSGVKYQGVRIQVFFPLKGTYKYTLITVNGAGMTKSEGSIDVPKTNLDLLDENYRYLVGDHATEGKTWVWDQDQPGGNVCYMTATYDWTELWWNPYSEDEYQGASLDLPGLNNEIKFDINDGFNYTRYETAGGTAHQGHFVLDTKNMTLTLSGAHLPNYNDENIEPEALTPEVYQIKILNDHELALWKQNVTPSLGDDPDNAYGWIWKFRAK